MLYGDFKILLRRTAYDMILRDKAFNIAKNLKYDRYQRRLTSIVYNFCYKTFVARSPNKCPGFSGHTGTRINFKKQQLTKELHKPVIKKFKKCKVNFSFKNYN